MLNRKFLLLMTLAITSGLGSQLMSAETNKKETSNDNQKSESKKEISNDNQKSASTESKKSEKSEPTKKELDALKIEGLVNADIDRSH